MHRLADLREILHYVPQYREQIFLISMDGAIVAHPNFSNILLDIALLQSLRIQVVLVHGASYQIAALGQQRNTTPSNLDGTGVTDAATLELALTAATETTHSILEGLTATGLHGAVGNAVIAHPAGILRAVDHLFTGRVERVEGKILKALLASEVVPIIPPLGCDRTGQSYRINSDAIAVAVAVALNAVKLIFLTSDPGVTLQPSAPEQEPQLLRQLTVEEAETLAFERPGAVAPPVFSKLQHAVRAARLGVPRIHVIDGRVEEGLLGEVFSNAGVGTLIHTNEYQSIRTAQRKDISAIDSLIRTGVENEELVPRTLEQIEQQIDEFYVFEIDHIPVGCVALHMYPEERTAELACLCVDTKYENQGVASRLAKYLESRASEMGAETMFCLSTQAFNYFVQKRGFAKGSVDDLPLERRRLHELHGRKSLVLVKTLNPE